MTPYLSIVLGIGGNVTEDLLDRLNNALCKLIALGADRETAQEIVIVEWNVSKPIDYDDVIPTGKFEVRVIHTGDLHRDVPNPHGFRYFEWFPKNIGLRRAKGEFLLSSNPDDLWSEPLAQFLSQRRLERGHFYRVNRHDTQDGRVFRICYPTGAKSPDSTPEQIKQNAPRACPWSENMLHYNASGDFTLMAKDDWFLIHGNPEREYNDSIDGQTLWLAHQKGLKQVVLPYPIYHPDHPRTLNLMNGVQPFDSKWDDNKPHARENGEDWGFAGMEFEETIL